MGVATNWFAAAILAVSILFYVFVYTIWLKRRTPQNIVIGGAAGAFPPLIGWAAVDRRRRHAAAAAVRARSSCGRRRISGRCRCSSARTMPRPACRCCRSSPAPGRRGSRSCSTPCRWRRRRSRPGRSASPGALYGVAAAAPQPRLPRARAARPRQPGDRARGDEAAKSSCSLISILYLFALFGALVADRWLADPIERPGRGPPPPARARDRSWRVLLGRVRDPASTRSPSPRWACYAVMSRNARTAAARSAPLVFGMAGLALCERAALPDVLPGRPASPARRSAPTRRAGRRATPASMISVRFDANTSPALPWRFAPVDTHRNVAIGARNIALFTARNLSDRAGHRHRDVQRHADPGRAIFHQDPVLLLHRADG